MRQRLKRLVFLVDAREHAPPSEGYCNYRQGGVKGLALTFGRSALPPRSNLHPCALRRPARRKPDVFRVQLRLLTSD